MNNPLVAKLRRFADLSDREIQAVEVLSADVRTIEMGSDILRQGDKPTTVTLMLDGLACRYKLSEGGDRQIVGIMVPGDLCDLHAFILNEMDHSVAALTKVSVTQVSREKLLHVFDTEPRITRALWWSTLVDEGTLREWVVNIATRSAYERLAHLLSEICMRLRTVGLASATECTINIRQLDLGDAVGVGRSHASLSMMRLKDEGIIEFRRGSIQVLDINRLFDAGKFNQHYLHLAREREH
jgi:CRP-like cAMP-binding protein